MISQSSQQELWALTLHSALADCHVAVSSKSTVQNHQVRLRFRFTSLQRHKKEAVLQHLLMQNMHLTVSMLKSLALIQKTYLFLSQTTVSKHLRLQKTSFVQAPLTSSSLTLLQHWYHVLRLKAKWVTLKWAFRHV